MSGRTHVIILNGIGSVGKSSTARALQEIAAKPFLHVSMDTFIEMLPSEMLGHPDGLTFETVQEAGEPCVAIRSGPVMARALRGMRHAIAAMAAQGNDLIVDDVILETDGLQDYATLLSRFDFHTVGLFAPLDVLETRERMRGDREVGLARWQFSRVHRGMTYDLEIETTNATPLENARRICAAFGL